MTQKSTIGVIIGRFAPAHFGHVHLIKTALAHCDQLCILIGSSNRAPDCKNPFTYEFRKSMLESYFDDAILERIRVSPLPDHPYSDTIWESGVTAAVQPQPNQRIILFGHDKDESSYYLKNFKWMEFVEVGSFRSDFSATQIRNSMFENNVIPRENISEEIASRLGMWFTSPDFKRLHHEWMDIKLGKRAWELAPYTPHFITTDAVVVQSGHILLIQRGGPVGRGLWALPGGYLDPAEWLVDGVIRELREETGLKVDEKVLRGSITATDVFDRPDRDPRGRIVTHAFMFDLDSSYPLPKVKGQSDAINAKWIPISDLYSRIMFADHYWIIEKMLGQSTKSYNKPLYK